MFYNNNNNNNIYLTVISVSLRLGKNTDTDWITDWVGYNSRAGHVSWWESLVQSGFQLSSVRAKA